MVMPHFVGAGYKSHIPQTPLQTAHVLCMHGIACFMLILKCLLRWPWFVLFWWMCSYKMKYCNKTTWFAKTASYCVQNVFPTISEKHCSCQQLLQSC